MLLEIFQCLNIFQLNVRDPFLSLARANMSGIFCLSDYSLQEPCRISDIVTRVEKTKWKCCCHLQQKTYVTNRFISFTGLTSLTLASGLGVVCCLLILDSWVSPIIFVTLFISESLSSRNQHSTTHGIQPMNLPLVLQYSSLE